MNQSVLRIVHLRHRLQQTSRFSELSPTWSLVIGLLNTLEQLGKLHIKRIQRHLEFIRPRFFNTHPKIPSLGQPQKRRKYGSTVCLLRRLDPVPKHQQSIHGRQ